MSDKSYVSMEQKQCPVCGEVHDSGAILMDRRLRPSMEHNTVTGFGYCRGCQEKFDAGYIAMVGLRETPRNMQGDRAGLLDTWNLRSGDIAWISREKWGELFNAESPPEETGMAFVDQAVIDTLRAIADRVTGTNPDVIEGEFTEIEDKGPDGQGEQP